MSSYIKGRFQLDNPDDMTATVELTMKLSEWKAVKAQLSDKWPSYEVGSVLHDLIKAAEQHFATSAEFEK